MKKRALSMAVASLALCASAQAALVSTSATTFMDTNTGYSWLNLGQFYGMSFTQMQTALPTGYSVATEAQAKTLTDAAPAIPGNYFADAAVMGVPSPTPLNRDLIWGFYGDGSTWLWKFSGDTNWQSNAANASGWTNNNYTLTVDNYADLGVFAVDTHANAVPEPDTYALMLAGLAGLAALRRRRSAR
jgi:hypothetical protein